MARVRLEFHYDGFNEVRTDPAVQAEVNRRAEAIAAAAGEGFEVRAGVTKSRARAVIITATPEAMLAQATDHRLERSIDAGRS